MNLFDLYAKIILDTGDYETGIENASQKTSSLANGIKTGLATAAKVGTAAITAAASGIAALTKASVENYAEYEQLVGGIDTLFGTMGAMDVYEYAAMTGKEVTEELQSRFETLIWAGELVKENAAQAFKTAGLSANEYMGTITSFAAALKQSVEDEYAAAEVANMAVIDMADNANKMGTSMDMIQNAYQGFAKQNYTMLDNLKLGYGGTKEEMLRLIDDASKINSDVTGKWNQGTAEYMLDLDNIILAIHTMQEEMGIAGATAAEAEGTISGSIASMKAAWQNLIVGVADDNADFEGLVSDFVYTVGTVAQNIIPRIEVALNGAASLIEKLVPIIMDKIPSLVSETLPKLIESGANIIQSIIDGISNNQDQLFSMVLRVGETILTRLIEMLPQLVELGLNMIVSLANGLAESIPRLIPTVIDVMMKIVDTLTSEDSIESIINAALEIITNLAYGLMEYIPALVDAALSIIEGIAEFLLDPENINTLVDAALEIVLTIGTGLVRAIPRIITSVFQLAKTIADSLVNTDWMAIGEKIVNGLIEGLKAAWHYLTSWFTSAWDDLTSGLSGLFGGGKDEDSGTMSVRTRGSDGYSFGETSLGGGSFSGTSGKQAANVSVVQNIYSEAKSAADLMQEAVYAQERAVFLGV